MLWVGQVLTISIHAPMLGATKAQAEMRSWMKISIHAPMLGATLTYWQMNKEN